MDPTAFVYWLNGLFELSEGHDGDPARIGLTVAQANLIKEHLALVLIKVTPPSTRTAPIAGLGPVLSSPGKANPFECASQDSLPGYPDGKARDSSGRRLCGGLAKEPTYCAPQPHGLGDTILC